MKKPIDPKMHAIADYVMSAAQAVVPAMLPMNSAARKTFQVMSLGMAANNAMTDTPAGVKPVISMNTHKKMDMGMMAASALLTFTKSIRKDKVALAFHLSCLGLILTTFLLTDFDAKTE
jgi:glucose uptake protein GlcU